MATLFERISGLNGATKLPIHIFTALLHELQANRMNVAQVSAIMDLDPGQESDLQWLKRSIDDSSDGAATQRIIKDHFYLSEWIGTSEYFDDEVAFFGKIDNEVVRQGGQGQGRN